MKTKKESKTKITQGTKINFEEFYMENLDKFTAITKNTYTIANALYGISGIMSEEDIQQSAFLHVWQTAQRKPIYEENVFTFFKYGCLNSIQTERKRRLKFTGNVRDKEGLIKLQKAPTCSLETFRLVWLQDVVDIFTREEQEVLILRVFGYTWREIDKIKGKRCDRIMQKLQKKAKKYIIDGILDDWMAQAPSNQKEYRETLKIRQNVTHNTIPNPNYEELPVIPLDQPDYFRGIV